MIPVALNLRVWSPQIVVLLLSFGCFKSKSLHTQGLHKSCEVLYKKISSCSVMWRSLSHDTCQHQTLLNTSQQQVRGMWNCTDNQFQCEYFNKPGTVADNALLSLYKMKWADRNAWNIKNGCLQQITQQYQTSFWAEVTAFRQTQVLIEMWQIKSS
jgi:hypothetical protein